MESWLLNMDQYEYVTDILKARESSAGSEEMSMIESILVKLEAQPLNEGVKGNE